MITVNLNFEKHQIVIILLTFKVTISILLSRRRLVVWLLMYVNIDRRGWAL